MSDDNKQVYDLEKASFNQLLSRNISSEVAERYGVRSILDSSRNDVVHFYPFRDASKNISWCVREVNDKKFRWLNRNKAIPLLLFNQERLKPGGKLLIITEGVCDCLAVTQLLGFSGKNYSVVSIANGISSAEKEIMNNYEWVNSFENIFLSFDMDEPGNHGSISVSNLFPPGKVKRVSLPDKYKDANDVLNDLKLSSGDRGRLFLNCLYNAKDIRSEGIIGIDEIYSDIIALPEQGLTFPWKGLNEHTYGYRRKEIHGVGGSQAGGKSFMFKELILNVIDNHNNPAGVIFLEEEPKLTAKMLGGMRANKHFHIPPSEKNPWELTELIEQAEYLKGKISFFNHWGGKDWKSIKEKIRFMVNALGIKDVFLDHLTALVAKEANEYTAINTIMEDMASLVQELDCTIFFISHLRKNVGTSFSEGGVITTDDFRGSGAIAFWSNFMYGIERNQQAEDKTERNTTTLRILKDRYTGQATGETVKLLYDTSTGRWSEVDEEEVFNSEV